MHRSLKLRVAHLTNFLNESTKRRSPTPVRIFQARWSAMDNSIWKPPVGKETRVSPINRTFSNFVKVLWFHDPEAYPGA